MTALFSAWLPLSTAVLVSVIECLPGPRTAQATRLPDAIKESPGAKFVDERVKDAMINFKTGKDDPVVAYVSKMVAVPESELPSNTKRSREIMTPTEARELARKKRDKVARLQAEINGGQADEVSQATTALENTGLDPKPPPPPASETIDREYLIGFARLYSGNLAIGDSVYVLSPKFSPGNPHISPEPQRVTVTDLYLLMGRQLESLCSVPAGVVFGIGGLAGYVLKTGTLCSQFEGAINLAGISMASPPIVRVALEPVNPTDLTKMIAGLKLLEQSDPCAQYEVLPSGEHVILTAGELHLERCLKDLRERFARCEIQAGEPIVPYRESIISAPEMAAPKNPDLGRGFVLSDSPSKQLTIKLRVMPLPAEITEFLDKNVGTIKRLQSEKRNKIDHISMTDDASESLDSQEDEDSKSEERSALSPEDFKKELRSIFNEFKEKEVWQNVIDKIMAFGPRRVGPNILIDATVASICEKL
jgi:ribosome assembly protein 1